MVYEGTSTGTVLRETGGDLTPDIAVGLININHFSNQLSIYPTQLRGQPELSIGIGDLRLLLSLSLFLTKSQITLD